MLATALLGLARRRAGPPESHGTSDGWRATPDTSRPSNPPSTSLPAERGFHGTATRRQSVHARPPRASASPAPRRVGPRRRGRRALDLERGAATGIARADHATGARSSRAAGAGHPAGDQVAMPARPQVRRPRSLVRELVSSPSSLAWCRIVARRWEGARPRIPGLFPRRATVANGDARPAVMWRTALTGH
jgi:hypothetical protein